MSVSKTTSYRISKQNTQPWDTLYIDLIGKYRMTPNKGGRKHAIKDKKDNDVYLQAITTMIDPATGWIETHSVAEVEFKVY